MATRRVSYGGMIGRAPDIVKLFRQRPLVLMRSVGGIAPSEMGSLYDCYVSNEMATY